MTTKQQHVSRFLEALLLRQAKGKLKNHLMVVLNRSNPTSNTRFLKLNCQINGDINIIRVTAVLISLKRDWSGPQFGWKNQEDNNKFVPRGPVTVADIILLASPRRGSLWSRIFAALPLATLSRSSNWAFTISSIFHAVVGVKVVIFPFLFVLNLGGLLLRFSTPFVSKALLQGVKKVQTLT